MRVLSLSLSLLAAVSSFPAASAFDYATAKERHLNSLKARSAFQAPRPRHQIVSRSNVIPQGIDVSKFAVNGSGLPDVDFDIGESYAGLMPISNKTNEDRQLYFWFFPTSDPLGKDEITIWLNGGPGCSSLEGFFQEIGPVIWQYGTFKPVRNPWTWVNLTSVLFVEQPVGTGFSQGNASVNTNENMVAADFLGFFKQFIDTFGLYNKKIFVAGESYAGFYVPYIADAMLNANDTKYYDLNSIMIYDPSVNDVSVQNDLVVVPFVDYHSNLFNLNQTFMDSIHDRADSCGYSDFLDTYLTFPPDGPIPNPPNNSAPGCGLFNEIFNATLWLNPCFDIYQVATTCPILWDVLGFPGSVGYLPAGAQVYFNRPEVQKAINAPNQTWGECAGGVLSDPKTGAVIDTSPPSGLSVLPGVIDRAQRTIISHGTLDMVLLLNGTLLTIQNMTFGGQQGFQQRPSDPFYVPYHNSYILDYFDPSDPALSTLAGSGIMGITHTERKLTWVEVFLSGHMVPQYAPSVAFRQLEFLLGRIDNLSAVGNFTTIQDPFNQASANATVDDDSY